MCKMIKRANTAFVFAFLNRVFSDVYFQGAPVAQRWSPIFFV